MAVHIAGKYGLPWGTVGAQGPMPVSQLHQDPMGWASLGALKELIVAGLGDSQQGNTQDTGYTLGGRGRPKLFLLGGPLWGRVGTSPSLCPSCG